MRAFLYILLLISASKADYTVRCNNSSETSLTFKPSEDNIEGRYNVEWCTEAGKDVTEWELVLRYIESRKPSKCQNYTIGFPIGLAHSRFEIPVTIDLNCTQVCLSTFLDLVFSDTCYHIRTLLRENTVVGSSYDSLHYVINNFTKEHFTNSEAVVSTQSYEAGWVELNWYLGFVPATDFSVHIWDHKMETFNSTCSVSGSLQSAVSCSAALPARCYTARLEHRAPWIAAPSLFGRLANIEHSFCQSSPGVADASSSPIGAWRAAAGVAVAVLLVLLVMCAVRRRRLAAWQRRVRDHWLKTTQTEPIKPLNVDGVILLLYARDCVQFTRAAERLGALVQKATGCRVIDVYSGESTRLWAPAGDEWLRLMLARDDTRVLLLQSPAGALLAAELADSRAGPALVAPLLGSRVQWRRPHAGDALLSLALRMLSAAPPPAPYRKHYVAGISGLGAEMAAGVTPQRRYMLPNALLCLLRDLAPGINLAPALDLAPGTNLTPGLDLAPGQGTAPDLNLTPDFDLERLNLEPLLRQFMEAADAFTNHVRDNPDYLADELLFK